MESTRTIPAPASSLGNLLKGGPAAVKMEVMKAAAAHGSVIGAVPQEENMEVHRPPTYLEAKGVTPRRMGRGDEVIDTQNKRKGVIIRELKAADGTPRRFEIVDRRGDAWKQRENHLRIK